MRRLFPHPTLFVALLIIWFMLTRVSLGQFILGSCVSILACQAMARIEARGPKLKNPFRASVKLLAIVTWDIVQSNKAVIRRIIMGAKPTAPSGFVRINLQVRTPAQLSVLALIITATPGSAWISFDAESGDLLIHVLELDGTDWQTMVRDRYESKLLEIFA